MKIMPDLQKIPFFTKLSAKELQLLNEISHQKSFKKGEILFYEGEEPCYLHVLTEGVLKLYKTNFKSQQIFLHEFRPVSLVAELANFESIPYPATAEFVTNGKILKIDYEAFRNILFNNPKLSFNIIRSLSEKLKIMSEVVHNEIILTAEAKIAKFIVEYPELFGELKQTKIAQLLNITPETLSRALARLKSQDLVSFDDKQRIVQKDVERLRLMYE
jgi:CRP/FNR family transcriptional regulator